MGLEAAIRGLFRRLVVIDEAWFVAPASPSGADLLRLRQMPEPVAGIENRPFETIVVDLSPPQEALWSAINPKTRTKISRAERDGMTSRHGGAELADALAPDYEAMRRRQGLGPLNTARIARLAREGRLVIGVARDGDGRAWAWHAWLLAAGRARQLHSVTNAPSGEDSVANAVAGRANRFLHWQALLHFKARGLNLCDLGGVSVDPRDSHGARVAALKSEFGGRREGSWDAVRPLTWKGRAVLAVLGMTGRHL